MIQRERESVAVAVGKQPILATLAAAPDRTHRMDHVTWGEPEALRDLGLSRGAAAELPARLAELRARGAVNGRRRRRRRQAGCYSRR